MTCKSEAFTRSKRIGTWNLEGRWDSRHRDLLRRQECDVWLLTEVRSETQLRDYHVHLASAAKDCDIRWAGILSRESQQPLPRDPHWGSVAAKIGGTIYCSTVLPWRS